MFISRHSRPAFTLFEMLLLLIILAVALGLVAVAVQMVRSGAAKAECQNRMRNQVTAIFNYEAREGRLPPGCVSGPFEPLKVPEGVGHGLWSVLLAELEQPAAAAAYHWEDSYNAACNQGAVTTSIMTLLCPTRRTDRVEHWKDNRFGGVTDYAPIDVNPFLADLGAIDPSDSFDGPLPVNGKVRLGDIRDGVANTILIAEAGGRPGFAWSSSQLPVSVKDVLGATNHRGTNVAFCDGSVRHLRPSMELKILARLATRNGNEALDGNW